MMGHPKPCSAKARIISFNSEGFPGKKRRDNGEERRRMRGEAQVSLKSVFLDCLFSESRFPDVFNPFILMNHCVSCLVIYVTMFH